MTVSTNDIARIHWASLQLAKIPRLATARNITSFAAWSMAEGGWWNNDADFNPLNTTLRYNGSHAINPVGVQSYKCEVDGLLAIAKTLNNGYYKPILAGLTASVTMDDMAELVGKSPWGTNGKLMLACVPRAATAYAAVYPAKTPVVVKAAAVVKHPVLASQLIAKKVA